jgi:hypothetical protein
VVDFYFLGIIIYFLPYSGALHRDENLDLFSANTTILRKVEASALLLSVFLSTSEYTLFSAAEQMLE